MQILFENRKQTKRDSADHKSRTGGQKEGLGVAMRPAGGWRNWGLNYMDLFISFITINTTT